MKRTFAVLNEMVRDGAIDNYAVAGAVAATFYVQPFATQDVDVLVWMPEAQRGLIAELPGLEYLRERGYSRMSGEGVIIEDWPVQFIAISSPLYEEAFLKRRDYCLRRHTRPVSCWLSILLLSC